jgi:hypothetical protein
MKHLAKHGTGFEANTYWELGTEQAAAEQTEAGTEDG